MAIAPSRLGELVADLWDSDDALIRELRRRELVRDDVSDPQLRSTFQRARDEHAALDPDEREYHSPNERVRVFLAPFLTDTGASWAAT